MKFYLCSFLLKIQKLKGKGFVPKKIVYFKTCVNLLSLKYGGKGVWKNTPNLNCALSSIVQGENKILIIK